MVKVLGRRPATRASAPHSQGRYGPLLVAMVGVELAGDDLAHELQRHPPGFGLERPSAPILGDGRGQDRVEGLLGAGGVVSVGLGQVAEAPVAAHDGDGHVGQAGEIAREVAHVGPAAVFAIGEVAHIVDPVLDVPVAAHQGEQFLGPGALCAKRGEAVDHFDAAFAGFEDFTPAFDARRLAASMEVGVAVPLGAGEAGARCGHGPCRRFRARARR